MKAKLSEVRKKTIIDAVKANELLWDEIFRYSFDTIAEKNDIDVSMEILLKTIGNELGNQMILSQENVDDYVRSLANSNNPVIHNIYAKTPFMNKNDINSACYVIKTILEPGDNIYVRFVENEYFKEN